MAHHPEIAALAQDVLERRVHGTDAPVLLLGASFSQTAGMPPVTERLAAVCRYAGLSVPPRSPPDVGRTLRAVLEAISPVDRATLALELTGLQPVPLFAQEVALLASDGYFRTIVTTQYDALVERALESAGLVDYDGYRVCDLVDGEPRIDETIVTVIKAYGDRIDRSPPMIHALAGMIVVVGPGADDPPLVNALAYPGGPLWWVAPKPPDEFDSYQRARETRLVTGDAGEPSRFFAELSLLLQQMPSLNVARTPAQAGRKARAAGLGSGPEETAGVPAGITADLSSGSVVAALGSIGGITPPDDEQEFERRLLRMRIHRCRETIRRLERRGGGRGMDAAIDTQLVYQRDELGRLETSLRPLEDTKGRVLSLLDEMQRSTEGAQDASTARFLSSLVERVQAEYDRPEPNQDIVGASLSALAVLADRVGVEAQVRDELATFAPRSHSGIE